MHPVCTVLLKFLRIHGKSASEGCPIGLFPFPLLPLSMHCIPKAQGPSLLVEGPY